MLSAIYTVTILYLHHRTVLCSANAPHVFVRCPIRTSNRTLAMEAVSRVSSLPPGKCRDSTLIRPFRYPSNPFQFANNPTLIRYVQMYAMANINLSSHTNTADSFSFSGTMNPVCSYALNRNAWNRDRPVAILSTYTGQWKYYKNATSTRQ